MAKCGVCQKRAGSGTFLCIGCNQWTHPPCGGYTKKEVQAADSSTLNCKVCKKLRLVIQK